MITLARNTNGKLVTFPIIEAHEVTQKRDDFYTVAADYTVEYRGKNCILRVFTCGAARLLAGFGGLKHAQEFHLPSHIIRNV